MNHIDENVEKLNLIKQIYEYKKKGFTVDDRPLSITEKIVDLKIQLAILKEKERKIHIEKELKFYECLFKNQLLNQFLTKCPQKQLLKYCYGSNEYYDYYEYCKYNKHK